VELEPHAICNRSCPFCLGGKLGRRQGLFPHELHDKVLDELSEIGYDGTIYYARYCEPLADERLEDLLRAARGRLPAATLKVITNGDLLSPKRLRVLVDAGLNILSVSLYLPEGTRWSHDAARERIQEFAVRLRLVCHFRSLLPHGNFADFAVAGLRMDARCLDFGPGREGFDRGGAVPELALPGYIRRDPCPFVFRNLTLDWNGNAMPCCNLHSDWPAHREFVLGNVREQSVFALFAGAAAVAWRRRLANFAEKTGPCRHCRDARIDWCDRWALSLAGAPMYI
jgi:radical SAM protein with 4Fe4S-binding SPASM domain